VADEHSAGQYPRFVQLQVDAGNQDYSVNLYDINYNTWTVRCLWQGTRLSTFGALKRTVICHGPNDWFSLDAFNGAIGKEVPFIPLGADGDYWVVRKHGETSGNWSYNPIKEEYVGHFADVEMPALGYRESLFAKDGRSRAWILAPLPDEWVGGAIRGTFVLQHDGRTKDIRLPIIFQARRGSGVPVIPQDVSLQFTPDGKIEFTARMEKPRSNDRVWNIEIESGAAAETVRPHRQSPGHDSSMFDAMPAPEYLRPYLKNLTHFGRSGLAPAFFMHMGVLKEPPEFPDCEAGVSHDGRHVLYKAKSGPLADVFIYGNLQTTQMVRWTSPAGIKADDFMDFVWVETP
jgi:hypothetical protein